MTERIMLVDYENIQAVDLKALPADVKVRFVLGGTQAKLPSELAIQAHSIGERFAYVRATSVERNACDFCIAFYLGEYLARNPQAECVILSKDKRGFDPLVQHLTGERGFLVRRVGSQKDAFRAATSATGSEFDRLTFLLKKEKAQPRKRKGLEGKVKGWFQDLPAGKRAELVQRLFDEGYVKETDKLLTFVSSRLRGV